MAQPRQTTLPFLDQPRQARHAQSPVDVFQIALPLVLKRPTSNATVVDFSRRLTLGHQRIAPRQRPTARPSGVNKLCCF